MRGRLDNGSLPGCAQYGTTNRQPRGLTRPKENHMTSPAMKIAIERAAQKVEDAHQAITAQEAEAGERAALAGSSCTSCGFSGPYEIAFDGSNMWVTNFSGHSVTRVTGI